MDNAPAHVMKVSSFTEVLHSLDRLRLPMDVLVLDIDATVLHWDPRYPANYVLPIDPMGLRTLMRCAAKVLFLTARLEEHVRATLAHLLLVGLVVAPECLICTNGDVLKGPHLRTALYTRMLHTQRVVFVDDNLAAVASVVDTRFCMPVYSFRMAGQPDAQHSVGSLPIMLIGPLGCHDLHEHEHDHDPKPKSKSKPKPKPRSKVRLLPLTIGP